MKATLSLVVWLALSCWLTGLGSSGAASASDQAERSSSAWSNPLPFEYTEGQIGAYVAFVGVVDKVTSPFEHITWLKGAGCDSTLPRHK